MSPFEKLFGKTAQLTVLDYLIKLEPLLENKMVIKKKIGKQI